MQFREVRGRGGSGPPVWFGSATALAIGFPILLWGILASGTLPLTWFVPACDAAAIVSMLVVTLLGSLDAELRRNRRSLPIVFVAAATAVMWAGHFAIFPGDIPALQGQRFNQATAMLFLTINLLTPLMLSAALVVRGGELSNPRRYIVAVNVAGALLGALVIAFAVVVGPNLQTVSPQGEFYAVDAIVGVGGIIPAVVGLLVYSFGLHGDERIAGGVLAALTFTALNSISLLYLHLRYTPPWYADHVLAFLPFAALVAGQLWLYTGSVVAEREAGAELASASERRRIGLDVAKAMARETDPMPVVDRLLTGVIEALDADRVTMLRLLPDGYVVERSVDREGRPASVGTTHPLDSVRSGDRAVVAEAVAQKRSIILGSYRVIGLDSKPDEEHAGVMQSIVMPLVRGGVVESILIVGRRVDRPFAQSDVDQLEELGAIAALLIRNTRLLAEAESSSRAKSSFINLAAHELGTPISVLRGYTEMLADESLGPITREQRGPMDVIRNTSADLAEKVDQLLIASRLDTAHVMPTPDTNPNADLVDVVHDAITRAEGRAGLIHANLTAELPERPMWVAGSRRDIGIILDNLLNNAMTYSHPPARVAVAVTDDESPEVRVKDEGIGVPDPDRERIFEQFYRVDNLDFGYPSGTGLGLYISRRLAEKCGGHLVLERSDRHGSVFTLRLRRAKA